MGRTEPAGGLRDVAWELLTVTLKEEREKGWEERDGKSLISLKAGMP